MNISSASPFNSLRSLSAFSEVQANAPFLFIHVQSGNSLYSSPFVSYRRESGPVEELEEPRGVDWSRSQHDCQQTNKLQ